MKNFYKIIGKFFLKIIHLSDLHFDTFFKRGNIKKTKDLIQLAVKEGFDHLVISGDISDNGRTKDFKLLKKILVEHNLLDSDKVTITIGNHDIFGGVQTAFDVVNFPRKCLKVNYEEKVKRFVDHFEKLFVTAFYPLRNRLFPFVKVIGDFVLIGLNTNGEYSRLKNPFASNGIVSKEQIEALKKIFTQWEFKDKRKIIISHHHFYKNNIEATSSQSKVWNRIESYTLKLRGKKKLIQLFKDNGVELVLHGHSHEVKEYERKGIKFVNAGGSIDNNSKIAKLISINMGEKDINVNIKKLNNKIPSLVKCKTKKRLTASYA